MALKIAYKKDADEAIEVAKKLPMDKDPVFMANLRNQIIADHNRKIREKTLKKSII